MWIDAVHLLLRAENYGDDDHRRDCDEYLAGMKKLIAKRMDLSSLVGAPAEQLTRLLELEIAWHRTEGIGDEKVFGACEALQQEVLSPPEGFARRSEEA